MSELKKHKKSDSIKWGITFVLLTVLIVGMVGVILQAFTPYKPSDWFKPEEQQEQPETTEQNGGAVLNTVSENGVKLTSKAVPVADYAPESESEYSLTATITPDSATNKSVDWSVEFVNPSSTWATGKTVTDYVTATPTSDGALTCGVSCLQAFGEQIVIKVISRDNPAVNASCTVDYSQKVTDVSLNIGDIVVNLDGSTNIQWQINANGAGFGDDTKLTFTESDVYTLKNDFTAKVEVLCNEYRSLDDAFELATKTWSSLNYQNNDVVADVTSSALMFDRAFFENFDYFHDDRTGGVHLNELSSSDFIKEVSTIKNGHFADIKVTITGTHNTFEYVSKLVVSEFVNTATVSGIELGNSSIIF